MSDETPLPEVTDLSSPNLYLQIACSLFILLGTSLSYKFIEPNGGTDVKYHAIYFGSAFVFILFLPATVASYIFTELTVTFIGCIYPIYRATKAVCTPEENDDKEWLQYWMIGGVLFMLTTWVDDVISAEKANDVWLGCLLFVFLWLYFPLTCGAKLFYEKITEPILGPKLKPLHAQMNNFILAMYQMLANATHLYAVWIVFMFLPAGLKRIVAIGIGTVYPFVSSVTAAATEDVEDDTVRIRCFV
jgi:Ca2+/Na+ antiporter